MKQKEVRHETQQPEAVGEVQDEKEVHSAAANRRTTTAEDFVRHMGGVRAVCVKEKGQQA